MTNEYLTKYVELATLNKIRYKIVFNKDYNTDLGLVLAEETAINQENIYIEKKNKRRRNTKETNILGECVSFFEKLKRGDVLHMFMNSKVNKSLY